MIPEFKNIEEIELYIKKGAKKYGSKNDFLASAEYKESYATILKIYQEAKAKIVRLQNKNLSSVNINVGDRVYMDAPSAFGKIDTYTGTVKQRKDGSIYIKLDQKAYTSKGIRASVPFSNSWRLLL